MVTLDLEEKNVLFQAPPPPPPPPPPEVLRTETSNVSVAYDDVLVVFAKGQQSERGLVRYQLFLRTEVEATRGPPADPATAAGPSPILCNWTVSVFLQRDPCVESITGRLACMQGYSARLDDRERGSEPVPEAGACTSGRPAVADAGLRLGRAVGAGAAARFDHDLKRRFTPELAHAGVSLRVRTR